MQHQFTEYEDEPRPQLSSRRSGGPPRKRTGAGLLDPHEDKSSSARPWSIGFTAFFIVTVLAIMLLTAFFLNR
jgi:hypothetical protein